MDRSPLATTLRLLVPLLLVSAPGRAGEFVGIPDGEFVPHYRAQGASMWCWASCVEMVFSYAGIELDQEAIVAREQGAGTNIGALPEELVGSINGLFPTGDGTMALISGEYLCGAPPPTVLFNHLERRVPAILLYTRGDGRGHAVVLTGIEVAIDAEQGLLIEALHVFDPAADAANDAVECRRIAARIASDGNVAPATGAIDAIVLIESSVLVP
jgi:hypothetical protein